MEGMDRYPSHPARDASVRSMRAVEAGDRESWIALFADDAVVEDPIGQSMFDSEGNGHRGREAITAFYDNALSSGDVHFSIRESFAAGQECANVGTITGAFRDGTRAIIDGVFTYRIDDAGNLAALRTYWETEAMRIVPADAGRTP